MVRRIRQEATESAMRGNHIGGPILRLVVCFVAVVIITPLFFRLPIPRDRLLSAALNVFLIVAAVVSVRWSTGYGIFLSLLFALAFSLSLPPAGHFHLEDARVWTLMTGCLVTGLVSGELSRRVRKEAQHARLSEKELRDLIETIPAMSWSALPDGSNTFVSGRWTEYTGLTTENGAGLGWHTAVHPEDLARHGWSTSLRTGQPFEDEARYRHRTNGKYRWYVVISISNSGVGLSTEKTDQIFGAFFTIKPNGTGMGLAITRRIIEAHGGRLSGRPNPDRGATFQFTWPTERAAHA
jgi:PAS domain S-box-containing protein